MGLLHFFLALNLIGLGDVAAAKDAFVQATLLAPGFAEAALAGRLLNRKPEHRRRITAFVRVAAGLEDPSTADALR